MATDALPEDAAASADVERIIQIVTDIRSQRTDFEIPPSAFLRCSIITDAEAELDFLNRNKNLVCRLTRIIPATSSSKANEQFTDLEMETTSVATTDNFELTTEPPTYWNTATQLVSGGLTFAAFVEGFINKAAVRESLAKRVQVAAKERDALAGRLGNPGFTEKAKPEAVEKAREDHAARAAEAERLAAALARLG